MLEFEYTRSALKNGLMLEAKLGVNPYKFGLVGSSDAHTGLASFEEDNFFGKTTPQEPSAHRMAGTLPRWTAYDRKYYGTERAYTSPIWYTPGQP